MTIFLLALGIVGLCHLSYGLDILDCIKDFQEHWQKNSLIHWTHMHNDESIHLLINNKQTIPTVTMTSVTNQIESVEKSIVLFGDVKTSDFVPNKQFILVPEVPDSWKLRLDSQVIQYEVKEGKLVFYDVYSIKNNEKRRKMQFGEWSREQGFVTTRQYQFWNDRRDLRNVTLVAAVLDYAPVFFNTESIVEGDDRPMGFFGSLLLELQKQFQFKIKYVKPPDGLWAGKDKDGAWNGMGKMLLDGEADLSPSGLAISKERSDIMDFSNPLVNDMSSLWSKVETSSGINIWVYVDIFTRTSSTALIIMVILLALGFFIVKRSKVQDNHMNCVDYNLLLRELAIVGVVVAQRDHPFQPARLSCKLLWITTCFFGFVIFSFFSAVLTSSMTIQPQPFQISEFSDILKNDFTMVAWEGSIAFNNLVSSPKGSNERRIFEETMLTKPQETLLSQKKHILQTILNNPKTVFFGNMFAFYGNPEVKFNIIQDAYMSPSAFAFQKDSEFLDLFNSALANLDEKGVSRKIRQKWMDDDASQGTDEVVSAEATSLGYDNVFFPFMICLTGVCGSLVLILLERVFRQPMRCLKK